MSSQLEYKLEIQDMSPSAVQGSAEKWINLRQR